MKRLDFLKASGLAVLAGWTGLDRLAGVPAKTT